MRRKSVGDHVDILSSCDINDEHTAQHPLIML